MSYSYNFVVKKTGFNQWTIFSATGYPLHVLTNCISAFEAENRARAWGSSWQSVSIKVEHEQD